MSVEPEHEWVVGVNLEMAFYAQKRVRNCCEKCQQLKKATIKPCINAGSGSLCGLTPNPNRLIIPSWPGMSPADLPSCTQYAYVVAAMETKSLDEEESQLRIIVRSPVLEVFEEVTPLNFVDKFSLFGEIVGMFLGISVLSLIWALSGKWYRKTSVVAPVVPPPPPIQLQQKEEVVEEESVEEEVVEEEPAVKEEVVEEEPVGEPSNLVN